MTTDPPSPDDEGVFGAWTDSAEYKGLVRDVELLLRSSREMLLDDSGPASVSLLDATAPADHAPARNNAYLRLRTAVQQYARGARASGRSPEHALIVVKAAVQEGARHFSGVDAQLLSEEVSEWLITGFFGL